MLYQFQCQICETFQDVVFPASEWDLHVDEEDFHKTEACEDCGEKELQRYIGEPPEILGGTNGYVSMERYWEKNPDIKKAEEDRLQRENDERHVKFKKEALKKKKKAN